MIRGLLLLSLVACVHMFGVNMVAHVAVKKLATAGAGKTATAPVQSTLMSSVKMVTPRYRYKDYYSKTRVDVRPVYVTTEYDPVEFSTVERETLEYSKVQNITTTNVPTSYVTQAPLVATVMATVPYEQFEWPLETQTYTQGQVNVTRIVENDLAFV